MPADKICRHVRMKGHIMTEERYQRIEAWFRARPAAFRCLKGLTHGLTLLVYFSYLALCLWTLAKDRKKAARVIGVPAVTYTLGSIVRALINAPRPYEVLKINPLVPKDTEGKSFPSRHVFSAGVIAVAFLFVSIPLGIVFTVIALVIAATRILAGVHWAKDVIAGLVYGFGAGLLGFFARFNR